MFFNYTWLWGSKIWISLDLEWSKRDWFANDMDFNWDLKPRSTTISNPGKWLPFCQKPLESWTKTSKFRLVWFSNGWDHSLAKDIAQPFKNWTI